jgi:hypothetical protein
MKCFVSTKRLSVLSVAAMAGLAVASCATTSHATLLWYDGFDTAQYTVGNALGGQTGGSGTFFTGPWAQSGTDANIVLGTSLTRPGQLIPSIGGSVGDTDCCGRSGRTFAEPWENFTDPDGTFYMGFMVNFGTGPTDHHRVVEMHTGGSLGDGNRVLMFGYTTFAGLGTKMAINVQDGTPAVLSENVDFQTDKGTTHFAVLKFDMSTSANDVISVYLDPVGTTEPATPSAQVSVAAFSADSIGAVTNFVFGDGGLPAFDELRVADNSDGMGFAQVANNTLPYSPAVPEPTAALLFGLCSLGLLISGRRKQK